MPGWLRHTFIVAIVISVLLHLGVAAFVLFFRLPMPAIPAPDTIEVFDARGLRIVDQVLKGNRQIPNKAEHAGMEDNAVTAETVARPQPERPERRAALAPQTVKDQMPKDRATQPPQQPSFRLPFGAHSLYAIDPGLYAMKQPPEKSARAGHESPARKLPALPRTAVSSTMNVESEAYLPEDYYPNYSYGAHTYLNVLRYPDVEYFVRLKRAFKQTWSPMAAVQDYMAGGGRRETIAVVLAVSVDPSGDMTELFVLRGSGSPVYDHEALRTVRANAPFSAPPEKLLKEGLLRMSWTFIVYM